MDVGNSVLLSSLNAYEMRHQWSWGQSQLFRRAAQLFALQVLIFTETKSSVRLCVIQAILHTRFNASALFSQKTPDVEGLVTSRPCDAAGYGGQTQLTRCAPILLTRPDLERAAAALPLPVRERNAIGAMSPHELVMRLVAE